MENESSLASIIVQIKDRANERHLSARRIYDMLESRGEHVSLNTIKKILSNDSENQSFNYYLSIDPIVRLFDAILAAESAAEKDRIIAEQAALIAELQSKNEKIKSKNRRNKTKYTKRADGRVVMTQIINGKRRYFYGKNDREVEAKYEEALKEEEARRHRSFETIADLWWEEKEAQLSPNSISSYRVSKANAIEAFGDEPIDSITPGMILSYLQRFSAQGYSQKAIGNKKSVLKSIFDYAFIAGDIDRNPCVDLPIVKGKPKEAREPASSEDIKLIEKHKFDDLASRMYYFMLYTGLRRGEAAALQYKHIDREKKTVRVEQSCAWDYSRPILKKPKTAAGIRTVSLTDNALAVIPTGHKPEEYIFFPDGLPRRRAIDKFIDGYRERTGVTSTPHQLRHSYASMLHSAGIDVKDAQVMLGHSSIIMTQDVYTHLEEGHETVVRNKLNKYVKKRQKRS